MGESADVALVIAPDDGTEGDAQLDRVAKLYKDGEFRQVIVSSANSYPTYNSQAGMTKYLEEHHVPSSSIIEDSGAEDMAEMGRDVADLMRDRGFNSVMVISDYYRMSRIKLALLHAGVGNIAKSHVGSAKLQDAEPIAREVCAFYADVYHTFLLPTVEKMKNEASTEADKASAEAQKAKDNVDKKLDDLPK
jgi:vancomycin permeability regulator SanA